MSVICPESLLVRTRFWLEQNTVCDCGSFTHCSIDYWTLTPWSKQLSHAPIELIQILIGYKVGDIIDSRDYQDYDIWNDWGYQADVEYGYQKFNSFCNDSLYPHSENNGPFGKTLIPDGAIITI